MNITTIVLIPGLWMTALCWEHWVKHYSDKGYCVVAPSWPGMEGDIELLRRDPSSFANLGLTDVVDHYEQIIRELETPSVIIGYGFGGLVTQILLDRGWGAAGVAIASAPVKGIARLPLSMLKLAFSVLGDSFNSHETTSLTPKRFHRAFANSLTESESLDDFKRYIVPAPNRVLLQTAPSRENHCPRPRVTSTISTKPCRRRSWRSSNACANSWKPRSRRLSPTIGLRISSPSTYCRQERNSASVALP